MFGKITENDIFSKDTLSWFIKLCAYFGAFSINIFREHYIRNPVFFFFKFFSSNRLIRKVIVREAKLPNSSFKGREDSGLKDRKSKTNY